MGNLILFFVKFYLSIWFILSLSILIYICFYNWIIPNYSIDESIFFHHDVVCTQMLTLLYHDHDHHHHHHHHHYHQQYDQQNEKQEQQQQFPSLYRSSKFNDDDPLTNSYTTTCRNVRYDIPNRNYRKFFNRGHEYYFQLELRMPLSDVNRNLGMFMIHLIFFDKNNEQFYDEYRPAILPYNSWQLSILKLITYIPLYLIGWYDEIHVLNVNLLDQHSSNINELDFSKIRNIRLEIETIKPIEIIPPSRLTIQVHLDGYKYWMYWWPITSSIIIITFLFSFIFLIYICSIIRKSYPRKTIKNSDNANDSNDDDRVSEFFNDSSVFDSTNDEPDSTTLNNNNLQLIRYRN